MYAQIHFAGQISLCMKSLFSALSAASVGLQLAALPAVAGDKGIYALGSLGVAQTDAEAVSFDEELNTELGLGYDFGNDIRVEVTWERDNQDSATVVGYTIDTDTTTDTVLFSVYKDFSNSTKLTPFIGGGIGSTSVNEDNFNWDSGFTYALSLGASYELSENLDAYGKVQTLYTEPQIENVEIEANIVSAKIGLRYSF